MINLSFTYKVIFPALLLSLSWTSAYSQESGESISAKGRSTPRSGIEQMQTFCILQTDVETSKKYYVEYPKLAPMIESALERNFVAKGFSKASSGNCDIEMHYVVTAQDQIQLGGRKTPLTSDKNLGDVVSGAVVDKKGKMRMGSLHLDAYNKSQNRKVWTGQATNTKGAYIDLNKPTQPDRQAERERVVNTAVDKLFLRFPARAR